MSPPISPKAVLLALAERAEKRGASAKLDYEIFQALGLFALSGSINLPRFTSDMTEAAKLFPSGWIWDVASTGTAWAMDETDGCEMVNCYGAPSPACALVSVALKAFAQHIHNAERRAK